MIQQKFGAWLYDELLYNIVQS